MAKKQQPKLLSPENYIRQKARNLPIYECLINDNWEKGGMAEIVVSRVHANGNITFGVYMIDLFCVGVKDTFYNFNVPVSEYEEMIEKMSGELVVNRTNYTLVHNIIFAALEYADELGFKPQRDFNLVSKYILEEDTEDIELIEIECGKNGKPFFIITDFYTPAQTNGIIRQLEKTVGKGNFDLMYEGGFDNDEDDEDDSEGLEDIYDVIDIDLLVEYNGMTANERREAYLKFSQANIEDVTDDDMNRLITLSESIYSNDIKNTEEVESYLDKWEDELSAYITDENYTPEMLGLSPDKKLNDSDIDDFINLDNLFTKDKEMDDDEVYALKELRATIYEKLKNKWGEIPYLLYRELRTKHDEDPEYFGIKLKEYCSKYPQYPLFAIEQCKFNVLNKVDSAVSSFTSIFGSRTEITSTEMFEYQQTKILDMIGRQPIDFQKLEAQSILMNDLDLFKEESIILNKVIVFSKMTLLTKFYE